MKNSIRIANTLPWSSKVARVSSELSVSYHEALGILVRWLAWLDVHTVDGSTCMKRGDVNELIFCDGCTDVVAALQCIGWAEVDGEQNVYAVDYAKHNDPTAKKRADAAARQRACRSKKK